jgi:hypothetical protein
MEAKVFRKPCQEAAQAALGAMVNVLAVRFLLWCGGAVGRSSGETSLVRDLLSSLDGM